MKRKKTIKKLRLLLGAAFVRQGADFKHFKRAFRRLKRDYDRGAVSFA